MAPYSPIREEAARILSTGKVPTSWPSIPIFLPHRLRRKFRSTRSRIRSKISPTSSITALQTSYDPADTIRSLRLHKWSYYDGQYLLLAIFGIFSLGVMESPGALAKTVIATLLMTSLILPITRQFFLPILPVVTWLVFFYSCQFVGDDYRPPIWVKVLPSLENIFYGANLSNILSAHHSTILDILAWLPYGMIHFGAPVVCSIIMFVFGPPGMLPIFARSFGFMNLVGVMIQLTFPCSPPWFENTYGLVPANYSMPGSPAGLAAIDELFGIEFYTSTFTASPLVFGAFPSLHAGSATMEALFMSHNFPKLKPLFIGYTLWISWATMYLSHHYAVDLVGGSLLSAVVFYVVKSRFLPRIQSNKSLRWDYDYVEVGEAKEDYAYGLTELDDELTNNYFNNYYNSSSDTDNWSLGDVSSSSPFSSGNSRSSSMVGLRTPIVEDGGSRPWDGETLASPTDLDVAGGGLGVGAGFGHGERSKSVY